HAPRRRVPTSVDEAIALMSQHGDEGRVIAGGHSLIPMMKLRLAEPGHLIDLRDLDSLRGIQPAGRCIEIGAMTTQQEVAVSELLAEACPILREAALLIADPQVRYCGTLGGNVANGDPGNDMPAVMQCLDASFVLRGPQGEREVRARDFYEAAYFTARAEDELVTAVSIPIPPAGHGYAYEKLKRKVGDYATAAAAVVLTMSGGSCESASIALTNVGQTPLFAEAAGQALVGTKVDEAAVARAVEAAKDIAEPVADMRGPEEYRTHVTGVMVRRAVERALTRARA
ncbi:MAG: xanthine dehydrogenase family protein subunit M, partial [Rhodospirillales bacterium]|nr:xanthine dehydrogenase family protein subunit M [Rhodospirillales bacterium]